MNPIEETLEPPDLPQSFFVFLGIAAVPIQILNLTSFIVGGIWLLILGRFALTIGAFVFTIVVPFVWAFVPIVAVPFALTSFWLINRRFAFLRFLGGLFAFAGSFIQHALIAAYTLSVFIFFLVKGGESFPYVLYGYAIATSPFTYMASKEDPHNYATMFAVLVSQISYIIYAVAYLTNNQGFSTLLVLVFLLALNTVLIRYTLRLTRYQEAVKNRPKDYYFTIDELQPLEDD